MTPQIISPQPSTGPLFGPLTRKLASIGADRKIRKHLPDEYGSCQVCPSIWYSGATWPCKPMRDLHARAPKLTERLGARYGLTWPS